MLYKGIYHILTTDADVAAFVDDRVYWAVAPQKVTFPCITWSMSGVQNYGGLTSETNLHSGTIQLDIWVEDSGADAWTLAQAVRTCLAAYRNVVTTIDNTQFTLVFNNETDLPAEIDTGGQAGEGIYRKSFTYTVWYSNI